MGRPFERLPREGLRAFASFQRFLELGPDRNVKQVAEDLGLELRRVKSWAATKQWRKRAAAYEEWLAEAQQLRAKKILEKDSEKWARRRVELREDEYKLAKKLIKKAMQLLDFPMHEKTIEEIDEETGRPVVTIIRPVRFSFRDSASMGAVASQLLRLSAELETSRGKLDVNVTTDLDAKIEKARVALDKLRGEMESKLIEQAASAEQRETVMKQLPAWVADNFKIAVADLEPGVEVLSPEEEVEEEEPLILDGMVIEEDIRDVSDLSQWVLS